MNWDKFSFFQCWSSVIVLKLRLISTSIDMYHNTKEHLLKDQYWLKRLKHTIIIIWQWFILALHLYFLVIPKVKHTKMVFWCKKKDIWAQHFCYKSSVFQLFICEDSPIFIHMKELAIPYQCDRVVKCRTNLIRTLTSFWELELLLFFNEKPSVIRAANLLLFGHHLLTQCFAAFLGGLL